MSKLVADAAAFKAAMHRQNYTSWHSNPAPSTPTESNTGTTTATAEDASSDPSPGKKKRPKASAYYHPFSAFSVLLILFN
jgi:transcription initiation factor TFIIE subunit beta